MPYSPPTLEILKASVARDLRDSEFGTFTEEEVRDLINGGIVEVNRVYPLTQIETLVLTDTDDVLDREYSIDSKEISRVEVWRNGAFSYSLPAMDGEPDSGWDLWGTSFIVPTQYDLDSDADSLRIYGYQDRESLEDDPDVAEFDAEAEHAVRCYAQAYGYQRLQNDRALFQQWLALPGNNDISPTQLNGMATSYMGAWERQKSAMRRLRR